VRQTAFEQWRYTRACLCSLLLVSPWGHAQTDVLDLPLAQLLKVKVTLPARSNQTLQQAPSSITVFTRRDISNMGLATLEALLNYVSGVQYHREGLESQVTFRSRRSGSSDILVLLDGVRLNDPVRRFTALTPITALLP